MNMRKIIGATLAALLLAALLALPAMAKVVSPSEQFYYLDQADVLSEATEGEIFFSNELLSDACGAQIVVAAINTTGSEAIDDYAYDLFNDWGIGDAKSQNGFLLLLAIEDDDYYAVCGSGLQSKLSSGALNEYFDKYLEADFAAKRYDAGAQKFFEAVFARIADTYNAHVTTEQGIAAYEVWLTEGQTTQMVATGGGARGGMAPAREEEGASMGLIIFVIVLIIVLAVLTPARRRWRRRRGIFIAPPPPPPPGPGPMGPGPVGRGGRRGGGLFGSFGGGPSHPSGGPSRTSGGGLFGGGSGRSSGGSFGASRPSGGGSRSFGSARGGGGGTRGGGAGRGRH